MTRKYENTVKKGELTRRNPSKPVFMVKKTEKPRRESSFVWGEN